MEIVAILGLFVSSVHVTHFPAFPGKERPLELALWQTAWAHGIKCMLEIRPEAWLSCFFKASCFVPRRITGSSPSISLFFTRELRVFTSGCSIIYIITRNSLAFHNGLNEVEVEGRVVLRVTSLRSPVTHLLIGKTCILLFVEPNCQFFAAAAQWSNVHICSGQIIQLGVLPYSKWQTFFSIETYGSSPGPSKAIELGSK